MTRPWVIMEVCGGETHSVARDGLDELLPPDVELVHGPGCPVCVTPLDALDRAHVIASTSDVILTAPSGMLGVSGTRGDLRSIEAPVADVRAVDSPLDALRIARENPGRRVVSLGVGFETAAPAQAISLARSHDVDNFSMLASHLRVAPALEWILEAPENKVHAFLCSARVCAVTGYREYEAVVERHRVPVVITGADPVDLLDGVLRAVTMLEAGERTVVNAHAQRISRDGISTARALVDDVFEVVDQKWRGIGVIPRSGLRIRDRYAAHDASRTEDSHG